MIEVSSTEIFASDTNNGSLNESIEIKIDIVKPIPASIPTPIICIQVLPSGNDAIPNLVHSHDVSNMPIGLPKNKPKNIPNPKGAVNPCTISGCQVILVLANANSGIIKKFTGFIKACSNLSKGDSTAVSFVGSVIATITPAIVACMPE